MSEGISRREFLGRSLIAAAGITPAGKLLASRPEAFTEIFSEARGVTIPHPMGLDHPVFDLASLPLPIVHKDFRNVMSWLHTVDSTGHTLEQSRGIQRIRLDDVKTNSWGDVVKRGMDRGDETDDEEEEMET